MSALLPSVDHGYLPYFLIYAGASAITHALVCYLLSPETSMTAFRGPSAPAPTALLAHVYAVKNIYTGAIRLYAAYNISNEVVYNLAMLTFIGVLGLYGLERFNYGTARNKEVVFPFITAGSGLLWMLLQRSTYVL